MPVNDYYRFATQCIIRYLGAPSSMSTPTDAKLEYLRFQTVRKPHSRFSRPLIPTRSEGRHTSQNTVLVLFAALTSPTNALEGPHPRRRIRHLPKATLSSDPPHRFLPLQLRGRRRIKPRLVFKHLLPPRHVHDAPTDAVLVAGVLGGAQSPLCTVPVSDQDDAEAKRVVTWK